MKSSFLRIPLMIIATAVMMLTACRKESDADDSVSAEDNSSVNSGLNATTDDAANAVGEIQALSGKTDGTASICGATIDTSQKANGIIVINYDGSSCNGLTKEGSITATLQNYSSGTRWKDAGAVLKLDFNNVKLTNTVSGAYFTLNGTHYITNVTGGLAWKIMDGIETGTVAHKHAADNFNLTFADGTQRTWSVRRTRTFTNLNNVRSVTLSGDTTIDAVANVEAWGTNRKGDTFKNALASPVISNSTCGFYKPVSGEFIHHVANRTADILFGVDSDGNQISSGCAYGFKVTFTRGNYTRTKVVSYWF